MLSTHEDTRIGKRLRSLRIAIADGHDDVADAVTAVARAHGHVIVLATDAPTIERTLAHDALELLFVDLGRAAPSGFEVARQARARFGDAIRIVAVTASADRRRHELAEAAGCDELLVRPCTHEQVEALVRATIVALRPGAPTSAS